MLMKQIAQFFLVGESPTLNIFILDKSSAKKIAVPKSNCPK